MLVLARQRDETIMIGDNVEVTVVDIRGDKVRIGINAPRSIGVHRKEIWDAIQRENADASKIQPHQVPELGKAPPVPGVPMKLVQEPIVDLSLHQPFLDAAIAEARAGLAEGGLPIGSVLVRNGKIIGRGHNRRVQKGDPMAHAEIDCMTNAGRQKTYLDTILYSTLMPCFLCGGASVQFGIPKVVVGESVNFAGSVDFMRSRNIDVINLKDQQCIQMMSNFIRDHADLWNEDIGV